jgi:hypothetical protein
MAKLALKRFSRLRRSVKASTSNRYRKLSVIIFSLLVFLALAFTTDIPWHLQTLQEGIVYWDNAVLNAVSSIYLAGIFSFSLTVIYSIASGLAITSIGLQLKNSKLSGKSLGGILPGFVATGCASCGVGLTGFIGLTGIAAALPFQGDLLKFGGLVLLVYVLYDAGDPETCEFNAE